MDGDSSTDGDNYTCVLNCMILEYIHSCMPPYAIFRRTCFDRN